MKKKKRYMKIVKWLNRVRGLVELGTKFTSSSKGVTGEKKRRSGGDTAAKRVVGRTSHRREWPLGRSSKKKIPCGTPV